MAFAAVVVLSMAMLLVTSMVMVKAFSAITLGESDRVWEDAFAVAEGGADDALVELAADPDFTTVSAGTDVSTRAAVVSAADDLAVDPANRVKTPNGEYVVVKPEGIDFLYVVGASPDWNAPDRKLRVIEMEYEPGVLAAVGCWPDAAIVGAGLVEIGGSSVISTVPASQHTASIIANLDFKGSSGIYVDGDVRAAGTVLNTPASAVYGDIESAADPLDFPTAAEINAWESSLIAEAQAGGTIPAINLSGPMTITAPVYIDGSVDLHSGAELTIAGAGTVYVNGHFEQGGDSVVNNGALLAVRDFFKQGGGTSYLLTASPKDAGLVSFYANKDAISFEGAFGGVQGVIYSARGGVKLTGSAALYGAAIAGGTGTNGQIKGNLTMQYPAGMLPSVTWLPAVTGGPGGSACAEPAWPHAAAVANGSVRFSGGGAFTTPAAGHYAHVFANGDYTGSGGAYVDGDVTVVGSASGDPPYGTVTQGSPPIEFPTQPEVDAYEADLIAAAQVGGTVPGASYGSDVTIATPLYVNGDLTISGSTITIVGGDVLYVNGTFEVSGGGQVYNDGVLAAAGVVKMSGGTSYTITGDPNGTAVIAFAPNTKAIELTGGSNSSSQGVAYAPNGGVKITGGGWWTGGVIAGGSGNLGKIELTGNSSIKVPGGAIPDNRVLPGADQGAPTPQMLVKNRREL